ncbi:MAG: GAF domain-containing sensor histidine kinase, partial [Myxococcales bacterium]|nr:GAF domain-containing sensor histidine kinase [Myxococcales bacterium]
AEDEALIESLGAQIAVAIENSKLFLSVVGKNMELLEAKEQLETKVRELDVLFEIAHVASVSLDVDELVRGALRGAMRAVDAGAAALFIDAEPQAELSFRTAADDTIRKLSVGHGDGISGWVAESGIPQRIADVRAHPKFSEGLAGRVGYRPRSVLSVPLVWDDGAGALTLFDKARGRDPFDDGDVKLASAIAGHISASIGLARARARKAREERLSVIGQFMSGVLHDLKSPMTVIGGYVQLLEEETDPAKRKRYVDSVHQQIGFIKAMTQETLAFARGDRKLWVRKVYLQPFFDELAQQITHEFEGKPVTLELRLGDRGIAYFDAAKIQRAIHNLARNAAEALAATGGRVVLEVERRSDDGALVMRVTDDGPGVPEEVQGRLFQSFATHGKANGTGLGLAIVQSVAEGHGGAIDFRSRPGQTTFTLTIPQDAAASGESLRPAGRPQ